MNNMNQEDEQKLILEVNNLRFLWKIFLCLPVLYLIICTAIDKYYFLPYNKSGFLPLNKKYFETIITICYIIVFIFQIVILIIKKVFYSKIRSNLKNFPDAMNKLKTMFIGSACFCDSTAAIGAILFLLNGKIWTMFVFGIIAMLFYAQISPGKRMIDKIKSFYNDLYL